MKKPKDSFNHFLILSIGFHVAILIVLTVKVLFFPESAPVHTQAVRVDVVALPEKQTDLPKPAAPEPREAPKETTVKKEPPKPPAKKKIAKKPKLVEPSKKKKPKKQEKEVEEDQASAVAKIKEEMRRRKEQLESQQQKPVEFKGNNLSKGNSLTGLEKLHHDSYLDELDGHIRSYWNLPEWLANGNFKARVLLLISRNGGILGKSFIAKSGNDLFDQYVFDTIDKASPLPAPPSSLIDHYATKGVEIRFPE